MQERHVQVSTPYGRMTCFVVHPDGAGPFRTVLMYMNVGGLSDSMRGMARRVAEKGYYCIVPDLYYRLGTIVIDPDSKDEIVRGLVEVVIRTVRDARIVMEDTRAVLDFLAKDPVAKYGEIGAIGYCMGGRFATIAAATFPQITATASMFGTYLISAAPDSPHLFLDKIGGEIYFAFAELDHFNPLEKVAEFERLVKEKCRARFRLEIHPGTKHGFAFPGRVVSDEKAAELSWQRIFAMFARQIPV